jgi:DnaK suppressor protein
LSSAAPDPSPMCPWLASNLLREIDMDTQTLESFRHRLLDRDQSLRRHRRRTQAEDQKLLEQRTHDWEHLAVDPATTAALDHFGESEAQELARIRASLDRIAQGIFGDCAICHGEIETERLRAIPETDRCSGCSHR